MKSTYYFHGVNAMQKAKNFARDRSEFKTTIYQQSGRVCVVVAR